MKKLLSFLLKAAVCAAVLAVGVRVGNAILEKMNPWENTQPLQLTDVGSPYKIYYGELDDIEKHAYNEILSNIYDMPESIRIPSINGEQLNRVFSALLYDNPDLFFIGRRCTLSTKMLSTFCTVEYIADREEYAAQKAELEKVCGEFIASLTDPEDDWQTEKEIHDYVIDNCSYKIVESEHVYSSAYGALVNGEAACEGYSKAAKLLLDMAGIENAVVSGVSDNFEGSEGPHMWNAVKIYGDYYYMDCTWDDPVSDDGESFRMYSYFNLNDELIAVTHSDFSYDFGCTATAANYYEKTGKYFSSYDRADEKKLGKMIAKELESGSDTLQIRFGSKEAYKGAVSDLIDGGRIYNVLRIAKNNTDIGFSTDSLSYFKNPEQLLLTVIVETN